MLLTIQADLDSFYCCEDETDTYHFGDLPWGLGLGSGKTMEFVIDVRTGQIMNWESFDRDYFKQLIRKNDV